MVKPTQDFQEVGHGEVDDSMAKHTLGDFGGLQRLSIMKNCRKNLPNYLLQFRAGGFSSHRDCRTAGTQCSPASLMDGKISYAHTTSQNSSSIIMVKI